ncbi:PQQ-binding-like beta-propeller repeat protein [Planctomicrobium sp. SH668]|uniref:outer membrane protein assembly factor BamB family protein n=1 Tax=Planctomicrobium sp. SH668 TaxID=3448126 RepID=UPI003F5C296C
MQMSIRLAPVVVAILLFASPAFAQGKKSFLPSEVELNRHGLTMAWWAQADVNASRDRVEFFSCDEQCVYVQSSTGVLTVIHSELGRKQWGQLIGKPEQQSFPVSTNENEVLVAVGLSLFSLKKETGTTEWTMLCPEYPSTSPQVDDRYLFIGTVDGSILAYDLEEIRKTYSQGLLPQWTVRSRLWNFQAPERIVSTPVSFRDDVIFASARGEIYSLKKSNKELNYQIELNTPLRTQLGFSSDRMLVCDARARMLCLEKASGRTLWTFAGGAPIQKRPIISGANVFVVPHRKGLTALNSATGVTEWNNPLASTFLAATDNRVYASDDSNNLLILDRSNGKLVGSLSLRDFSVRVTNDRTDRIFLSSPGGTVIALREIDSTFPPYYLNPERRPISPEFAAEEETEETAAE